MKPVRTAALALFASAAPVAALPAFAATGWTVDPAASSFAWSVPWAGAELKGKFTGYKADIAFDPADLAGSKIAIEVPVAGMSSDADEVDEQIPSEGWFAADTYPTAHFVSDSIVAGSDGGYVAKGKLTLRDKTQPLDIPFTVAFAGSSAEAKGTATVHRTAFGVGQGEWAATDRIGDAVTLSFDLKATKAP